eukprot:4302513-Lingulodinium_polyedra.AAC.1
MPIGKQFWRPSALQTVFGSGGGQVAGLRAMSRAGRNFTGAARRRWSLFGIELGGWRRRLPEVLGLR